MTAGSRNETYEGRKNTTGHLAALLTILIWGTTFISTKVLLRTLSPMEILFSRFLVGYLALWLVSPRLLKVAEKGQEKFFALAGLCGVTLYYFAENVALTYTLASNVGVIISVAPFFTAVFDRIFFKENHLGPRFFAGFVLAMAGICLISFKGQGGFEVNLKGDFLALAAAVIWAAYATITRKIGSFGYPTVLATRHTFFYGLLFMIPVLCVTGFHAGPGLLFHPETGLNLLFLGLGASALCFVTWNFAVGTLGAVKTSVYIYMVPVITTAASALVLKETITGAAGLGILLTLCGLGLSESSKKSKGEGTKKWKTKNA